MLNVTLPYCFAECHYGECHYAECHYAEGYYAKCRWFQSSPHPSPLSPCCSIACGGPPSL
jgi:hypothetical protein